MTSPVRLVRPLASLLLSTLLGGGCELFAELEPCTPGNHSECLVDEVCGGDGFCRPTPVPDGGALFDGGRDDDGGPPSDAGHEEDSGVVPDSGVVVDGGAPSGDGGAVDAGPNDDGGAPNDGGPAPDAATELDAGDTDNPCGNGVLNVDEECDDAVGGDGDGCDADCLLEPGWLCVGAPSSCTAAECGDGIVAGAEECDDGADVALDGCDESCVAEDGWLCDGASPTTCAEDCGDGNVVGDEECDDGVALNSDSEPDACRTTCLAAHCGDGVIDADPARGEVCDGAALGALYCLEGGYLPGTATACGSLCQEVDVATCGAAIDSVESLQSALLAAYERDAPSVIAIQPGDYVVDATIPVEDTDGVAYGVVLRPLSGGVRFSPVSGFNDPLLRLAGEGHRVERLSFANATRAIEVTAPNNVIERSSFSSAAGFVPADVVYLTAGQNVVRHNRFLNDSGVIAGRAIHAVDEDQLHIVRNVIRGGGGSGYSESVRVVGTGASSSRKTYLAHNSVDGTGNFIGIHLEELGQLCFHNNIVRGNVPTTGLRLAGTLTLGTPASCTAASQSNAVVGMSDPCTGNLCTTLCDSSAALCDLSSGPNFDGETCLGTSSALIDVGVDVGYAPVDESGATLAYTGAGPDVGAREAGTSTAYGDSTTTTCPAP